MRTILVPLDGSASAELGLRTATCLAVETGAELVLLRAGLALGNTHGDERQGQLAEIRDAAAYLEGLRQHLQGLGLSARPLVLPGDAMQAILFAAETENADLISMATHGHGGLLDRLLGSVTAAVLRAADRPVLVTRADCPSLGEAVPLRAILVGLDGTQFAEGGLSYLAESGLGLKARILLAQAVQSGPPPPILGLDSELGTEHLATKARQDTERRLQEAESYIHATALEKLPRWDTKPVVMVGEPGPVLVDVASGEHADLVMLMTHGRRGMDRMLNGSVAATVLRHSSAPVLILHGTESAVKVAVPVS